jgi:hypothetical protein
MQESPQALPFLQTLQQAADQTCASCCVEGNARFQNALALSLVASGPMASNEAIGSTARTEPANAGVAPITIIKITQNSFFITSPLKIYG